VSLALLEYIIPFFVLAKARMHAGDSVMTKDIEIAKLHKQTKHTMAHYIDGFVILLPKNKIDDDRRIAQKAGEVWLVHGALEYRECGGEDRRQKLGAVAASDPLHT
jgi:hypothetical protein